MFAERFTGKIINIGHRGAPGLAPENTIPSFIKALESGADGIELDVSLSRDGAIMVFHDYFLQKKTDGKGLLSFKTRNELQKLDAGFSFCGKHEKVKIPTLQEVVESIDKDAFIMIEIKTNYLSKPGIEDAVAALIKKYNLYERTVISSFNPLSLRKIKKRDHLINVGFLHFPLIKFKYCMSAAISMIEPEVLHPCHKMVNEAYLRFAREKGCRVITWTLKNEQDMLAAVQKGVNGIITDYPDIFKRLYNEVEGA